MGIELNVSSYKLFLQIEIGIREFMIDLIRDQGIKQWINGFLGSVQRDTIQEITKRIVEANKQNEIPTIEDIYIYKLFRAKKELDSSLTCSSLYHPFYYLNWTDLEALLNMKSNVPLIEKVIGKIGREIVCNNLKSMNYLRNDIAHSRFISVLDFKLIKSYFEQIAKIIPGISETACKQSVEHRLGELLKEMDSNIEKISKEGMLTFDEIHSCIENFDKCLNSFWINTFAPELIGCVELLRREMINYEKYRKIPGGLIQIQEWRKINNSNLTKIKQLIRDGKI